jgi:hypothetical protein
VGKPLDPDYFTAYRADPDNKARALLRSRERQAKIRDYINVEKTGRGCIDCGYNEHPAALDFDHVRGEKLLNVSAAKSIAQAKAEIEKCEVRCANCHRLRTWERLK